MARLLPCYLYISRSPCTEEIPYTCQAWKNSDRGRKSGENKRQVLARGEVRFARCCSSTSTSPSAAEAAAENVWIGDRRNWEDEEGKFEYLVSEFGWKVRRLAKDENEMGEVAQIQAEAFHTPVALFDDLFFEFFKAEVLSGLLYKLRNSPPDRYACLVAEPAADSSKFERQLVGIVDVTVLRDRPVLEYLSGAQEYLYISGIAVSENFRRQKIATVLLKACDVLAVIWGFEYLVLRAYEDDFGARKLYSNAGYRVVSSDPQWLAWTGKRRRVLMIKRNFGELTNATSKLYDQLKVLQ